MRLTELGFTRDVYGRTVTFTYNRKHYTLSIGAGTEDSVHVFRAINQRRTHPEFYVVTCHSLPCIGAARYTLETDGPRESGSVFLQGAEQCEEALGPTWDTLKPMTLARRLDEYM